MINCPQCQQIDAVRKVTYLTTAGTTESQEEFRGIQRGASLNYNKNVGYSVGTQASTISGTVHSISATHLAQKLLPPQKPVPPTEPNKFIFMWYILPIIPYINFVFPFVVFFAPMTRSKKLLMIGSAGLIFLTIFFLILISNLITNAIIMLVGIGITFLICIAFIIFYYWGLIENQNIRRINHEKELSNWQNTTLQRYNIAVDRWNNLYHCARCDVVFLLDESRYLSIDHMNTLLYS